MISPVKKLLSITFTCCIILSAASGTVADNMQPRTSLHGGVINTNTSANNFTKEDLELVDGRPRCCAHGCRHGGCVCRSNCYWRHGRRVCPRSNTNLTNLQVVDEAISNDEDEEYDNEPDSYDDYDDNEESSKNAEDETVGSSQDVELVNREY